MTDNEIIKALECCTNSSLWCGDCPASDYENNTCNLEKRDILDLINRQKTEIERLQKAIKVQEIMIGNQPLKLQSASNGAYKEFAERLCEGRVPNDPVVIAVKCELKAMTDTFTKLPHSSLCETETYEGK